MNTLAYTVWKYPCPICHSGEWKTYINADKSYAISPCPWCNPFVSDAHKGASHNRRYELARAEVIARKLQNEVQDAIREHNHAVRN